MQKPPEAREALADRVGLWVCVAATLIAVWLHFVSFVHAGSLWRDEAGGVQLSNMPGLGVTCRPAREWFPVFFFALVRGWSALGLGASDLSLRVLGLLIGLLLLGAIWASSRLLSVRWPLITLGLLAANFTVVRWGDSLRAYGCGAMFIVLTLGLVWRLVQQPGAASFVLASLAAILSVQSLYPNAFLVLATCLAGCIVSARHGRWRTVVLVLGVGLLAAASLLPYLPIIIASREYFALHEMGFSPEFIWASLSIALGSGQTWPLGIWLGLSPLVIGVTWEALQSRVRGNAIGSNALPLFGASAVLSSTFLFLVFLRVSKLPAEPWYFVPAMVFGSIALDASLNKFLRGLGFLPAVCAAIVVCGMLPTTLKLSKYRQTNVDLIAAELQRRAQPGDMIVVSPAYCGITFARYFKAPIAWTSLPPVGDYSCHRADLVKQSLCSKPLLTHVLDQAARTLQSGHALWIVGSLSPPEPGESVPPDLPPEPAPGEPFGYLEGCIRGYIWERQVAHLLDTRAQTVNPIACRPAAGVIPQEDLPLLEARGWRVDPPAAPPPQ
jgi:hypothetical protein